MTHNRMPQSDYRLAEKLRKEYRSRGEDLRGIGAASTEELMDRAKRGRDPRENVSEAAFSERLQNRNYTYSTGNTSRTSSQYTRPASSFRGGSAAPQYTDGRRGYTAQRVSRKNGNTARQKKHTTRKQKENREEGTEIRLRSQRLSVGFVAMLCIVTVMVMSIVFSIAQIYQTTNSIGKLENQLEDLREEAEELELALEKKNDIRVIEKIATDQLGMVKEDSVQRKYISLSDGERIDIIGETESESADSPVGTMLSSIAAAFSRFLESLGG